MASNEELERRIEALEEKVRRMERVIDDPTRMEVALPVRNDAVLGYPPPLTRIDPHVQTPLRHFPGLFGASPS